VLLHGAMQSSASQLDLARLLADRFRVHLVDRRGHGGSGSHRAAPYTAREVADLGAVLGATGATRVFGVSSGAIVAARAALTDARITALALFEPPLPIEGSLDLGLLARFDDLMATDDLPRAMGVAMKAAEMGPSWMFGLPVGVLAAASRRALRSPATVEAVRALPADFGIVRENADRVRDFAAIRAATLVISGTATRPYLRRASAELAAVVPGARHELLAGQWHGVTQNRADRGRPELVAPVLQQFFESVPHGHPESPAGPRGGGPL
jgi:pimeloyl-ACP methyl ester carboxylesterase